MKLSDNALIAIFSILFLCTGVSLGYTALKSTVMRQVEHTVQESVQTGKPFIFESGRMGLIEEVHHARNGKTVAYRVISFTWPEDK